MCALGLMKLSDCGMVNLLSRSYGVYNFNELGLQKCSSWPVHDADNNERTYRCASHEMRIFGSIGSGASSVVQRAIHVPTHKLLALKKINIFEKVPLIPYILASQKLFLAIWQYFGFNLYFQGDI